MNGILLVCFLHYGLEKISSSSLSDIEFGPPSLYMCTAGPEHASAHSSLMVSDIRYDPKQRFVHSCCSRILNGCTPGPSSNSFRPCLSNLDFASARVRPSKGLASNRS